MDNANQIVTDMSGHPREVTLTLFIPVGFKARHIDVQAWLESRGIGMWDVSFSYHPLTNWISAATKRFRNY